jgi:hypothetical protein
MKMHIARLSLLTLCAAAILAAPASSLAQAATNTPSAAQTPAVKKSSATPSAALPFHGTLTAVDTNAMTLTVEKRTFNMTSETIVTKDDKPAVLAEGVVGAPVSGAYKKNAEGKLDAVTVRFGGSAEGKKKKESAN